MPERFEVWETPLAGLRILRRRPVADHRGYLERLFCSDELGALVDGQSPVQINHTVTYKKGTLRGMHFQHPPHAETKLISCLRGEVADVAVDLRADSPTFLVWHMEILSADNYKTVVIPKGFAHGFQTLTEDCEMLYFHTEAYHPDAEGGINAVDPRLAIKWPLAIASMSPRDAGFPLLDSTFAGLTLT